MSHRRFFLLDESCSVDEIKHMMCRVVANKLLPLHKFVPFEAISKGDVPHNTDDIIPNILPPPSQSTTRKEFLESVRGTDISTSLTAFFGLDFSRSQEEKVSLESELVKRYTLKNPEQYFDKLMANDMYANDVRNFLQGNSSAYLVVGFLTTTGTIWKAEQAKKTSEGISVTAPVSQLAGVPIPGLLDPSVGLTGSTEQRHGRQMHIADEEIFAVAYCEVRNSYSLDKSAPKFIKKIPKVGPAKRAKGKHLAFEGKSDEESDSGSDEEDAIPPHTIHVVEAGLDGKEDVQSFEIL
jgi:hypothetical protein